MISRRKCSALALVAVSLAYSATRKVTSGKLRLNLRSRVEAFKGSGDWREVHFQEDFPVNETAILICDMWDKHWCTGASRRVDALAGKMAPVLEEGRSRGIQIVHSPSDVMDFYKNAPQRKRMIDIPPATPPPGLALTIRLCQLMIQPAAAIQATNSIKRGRESTPPFASRMKM
jgi:hypothetical protein